MTIRTDFLPNVDVDAYYAGTLTDDPALSQHIAHTLVSRSPKHAWAQHPRLGGRPRTPTDEMEMGNILDELVLGGSRRIRELPYDDYRTKEAKTAKAQCIADGKIPVKSAKLQELREAAESARTGLELAGVQLDGVAQACLLWGERASDGTVVQCCGLLDMLWVNDARILDLKTAASCHPNVLGKKCHTYGYHLQAAAYISAVEHVFPALAGRVTFENAWMETGFPHVTVRSEMDGEALQLGRVLWQRAIDTWAQCRADNRWPGYTKRGEVVRVALPTYAFDEAGAATGSEDDDNEWW